MARIISIVGAGAMGAAIARRLTDNGLEVRTSVTGRGEASTRRAEAAGMRCVDEAALMEAELFLSIVPPGVAQALADRFAALAADAPHVPIYVDCNAVNPGSVERIAATVAGAAAPFVDGSIIGMPPRDGYAGPTLFVSGERAGDVAQLSGFGLQVHVLDAPAGAASALKMAYGGITKGLIAIGSAMVLGAERHGVGGALFEEMGRSQSQVLAGLSRSIPDMFPKAGRWVSEMEEISAFLGEQTPQGRAYAAIASFYQALSEAGGADDAATIAAFFDNPKITKLTLKETR
jgi:3-hydroxyisobutyrate dehydrogenase-like beta-hydroxyacid dehydrogenase